MKKESVIELISLLFIVLFLYTGISKLMDYSIFKEQIATSPLLAPISRIIAVLLPWVEFLVVSALALPRYRTAGLYASLVLMITFTCYIIGILIFNKNLPCSCGGVVEQLSWKGHLVFNSVFICMSLTGITLSKRNKHLVNRKAGEDIIKNVLE